MIDESIKKLRPMRILKESAICFWQKRLEMMLFSGGNYLIAAAAVYLAGGWQGAGIWPVLIVYYLFWSFFFRYYFAKKPYLDYKPLMTSLVPSVKIVFLTVIFSIILALLPFIPLFLGIPYFDNYINSLAYADDYTVFLQKYMQESPMVDIGLNLLLVLVMPFILYRPFLAWIAAILGRRGSLRVAWKKSKYNYWQFVLLGIIMNLPLIVLYHLGVMWPIVKIIGLVLAAPLLVYYNIVIARIYSFFYDEG